MYRILGLIVSLIVIGGNAMSENYSFAESHRASINTGANPSTQTVDPPCPTADFSYTYQYCFYVYFTDQSTVSGGATLVDWNWDFGDGNTSTLMNPFNEYSSAGTYTVRLVVVADSMGYICRDTAYQSVIVGSLPDVSFTLSPDPAPVGEPILFTGNSTDSIVSWEWDFGDGYTDIVQNPSHTYDNTGVYTVTLTVTGVNSCENTTVQNITVVNVPGLDFTWSPACFGEPIQFTLLDPPTDIPAIESIYWDFGDGNTSTLLNPAHYYADTGTYFVYCSITDTLGDSNSLTKRLVVSPPPEADFDVTGQACYNNPVQFTDLSTTLNGEIVEWYWDFGDGTDTIIFAGQNPDVSHIYTSVDTFNVVLSVTDSAGCTDTSEQIVTTIYSPDADFMYEYNCYDDTVYFTSLSYSSGGYVSSWLWNFGDTLSGANDTSTLQHPAHLFTLPGDYNVELTATDNNGCYSIATTTISLFPEPVEFSWENTCFGDETQFIVNDTITNIGDIITWEWSFGDGSSSTSQNPVHTYDSTGAFVVTLSVETTNGCTGNKSHIVNIYDNPDVEIITPAQGPIINIPYQFNSNTSTDVITWMWDFGDGNTSSTQNPVNTYNTIQSFNVSLDVANNHNCHSTDSTIVEVIYPPFFPDSNAVWNIIGNNIFTMDTYRKRLALIGDTTIDNGKNTFNYSKVYSLYDSVISMDRAEYMGAVRKTEDSKVYLKLPDLPETILYDFNAELNDTIWYTVGGVVANNTYGFEQQEHYKVVTIIDSILLLDNNYHKRMRLAGNTIDDIWAEGMGSILWAGLFNPIITDIATNGDEYNVACMKDNDIPLYIDNPTCNKCFCYLISDIEKSPDNNNIFTLYPNPANDHIIIQLDNISDVTGITICNSVGTQIYSNSITDNTDINITNWPSGIYFVIASSNNQVMDAKKFIIVK